jgi:fluoroacetyl-CoA thioesterase
VVSSGAGAAEDPTRTEDFIAEGDLLTDVGGTLPHKVLSTPGMIHVMEWACTRLIREAVPDAGPTVGFEVCVKHVGGAPEGTPLQVVAVLREVVDGRKFRCDVAVRDGERTIGVGTHERRVLRAPAA